MIDLIGTLRDIWNRVDAIFDMVRAQFVLKETGGALLADGTEQVVMEVATPMGVFKPLTVKINCGNMTWGDSTTLRWYEITEATGALVKKDELALNGPQVRPLINVGFEPNRHGMRLTLQQTAGVNRNYSWEYLFED